MRIDTTGTPFDGDKVLARLRANREAIPWPERRKLVSSLGEMLTSGRPTDSIVKLLYLLSEDSKWEVRKGVADLLVLLPNKDLARLSARLSEDPNAFVRKAADRAVERRTQSRREAELAEHDFDTVLGKLAVIEKQHGKEAARQARQLADQLYDLMIGAVAHDMRGILTRLTGRTAMLERHVDDGLFDPVVFRKALAKIAERLAFLERLVGDMQAFSRQLTLDRRRERLSDIVTKACNMARDRVLSGGHDPDRVLLIVRLPALITLDAARHVILTAIANVIHNAYDALLLPPSRAEGGKIEVLARVVANQVEIVVRDNGIGMYEEDLREVRQFIPGRSTKKGIGTGFGLPIARRNIEAHGGSIGILSRPDEGTTVTITLPLDHEP